MSDLAAGACAVAFLGLLAKVVLIGALLHVRGLPGAAMGAGIAIVLENSLLLAAAVVTQRMTLGPLLARCWRVAAACAVMAGTLSGAGLAWTGWSEPFGASVVRLFGSAATIPTKTLFGATPLATWFSSVSARAFARASGRSPPAIRPGSPVVPSFSYAHWS